MATGDDVRSFEARLAVAKAASWAQLLFKCARLLNERALAELRRRTGQPVRAAHTALLPHIDLQGTRPSVLAERLGVTKQAVGQLVDEMVAMGMLERVADPADARARLVRFSAKGRKGLVAGLALLGELEAELAAQLGKGDLKRFADTLARLSAVLEGG